MKIFVSTTPAIDKKKFLFQVFDRENKKQIPIMVLKNVLTSEVLVRSHYSDVESKIEDPQSSIQIKSQYSDAVIKDMMMEVMDQHDIKLTKQIDYS